MYTPPPFKPDRARSLAFAEAQGFGLVSAWDGVKPVASSLRSISVMPMTGRRVRCFMSPVTIHW